MPKELWCVLLTIVLFTSACAKRVPEPVGVAPGVPHISWIVMHGDSDNPDQEFACQSDPRNDCVVPASRPDAQVFSDVHVYYHGVGVETRYAGTVQIGHFQGTTTAYNAESSITVLKTESIGNQSFTGVVTATPGTFNITFAIVATITESGKTQRIDLQVPVVVK